MKTILLLALLLVLATAFRVESGNMRAARRLQTDLNTDRNWYLDALLQTDAEKVRFNAKKPKLQTDAETDKPKAKKPKLQTDAERKLQLEADSERFGGGYGYGR